MSSSLNLHDACLRSFSANLKFIVLDDGATPPEPLLNSLLGNNDHDGSEDEFLFARPMNHLFINKSSVHSQGAVDLAQLLALGFTEPSLAAAKRGTLNYHQIDLWSAGN